MWHAFGLYVTLTKYKATQEFCRLQQTSCDKICESYYILMNFLWSTFIEKMFRDIVENYLHRWHKNGIGAFFIFSGVVSWIRSLRLGNGEKLQVSHSIYTRCLPLDFSEGTYVKLETKWLSYCQAGTSFSLSNHHVFTFITVCYTILKVKPGCLI